MTVCWTLDRGQTHTLDKRLYAADPATGETPPPVNLLGVTSITVESVSDFTGLPVISTTARINDAVNGDIEFDVDDADTADLGTQTVTFTVNFGAFETVFPLNGTDTLDIVVPGTALPTVGAPPTGDRDAVFNYDGNDRLETMTVTPGGTVSFTYDVNGNLTNLTGPFCDVELTYDADNRLATMHKT